MVEFWVNRIKQGRASIDDVPARWKAAVQKLLDEAGSGGV